jgi:hypothetical protein
LKKLGAKRMSNPVYYARIYLRRKYLLIYTRTRSFLGWHHQNSLKEAIYQLLSGIGTLSSSHFLGLFEINIYAFDTLNYQGESDLFWNRISLLVIHDAHKLCMAGICDHGLRVLLRTFIAIHTEFSFTAT